MTTVDYNPAILLFDEILQGKPSSTKISKLELTVSMVSWLSQPAFTCSKLTVETLEQVVKYVLKLKIKTAERHQ